MVILLLFHTAWLVHTWLVHTHTHTHTHTHSILAADIPRLFRKFQQVHGSGHVASGGNDDDEDDDEDNDDDDADDAADGGGEPRRLAVPARYKQWYGGDRAAPAVSSTSARYHTEHGFIVNAR